MRVCLHADGAEREGFTLTEVLFTMSILSAALLTMLLALGDSRQGVEKRESEAAYYHVLRQLRRGIQPDFDMEDWRLDLGQETAWLGPRGGGDVVLLMSRGGEFLYLSDERAYASGVGAETKPSFLVSISRRNAMENEHVPEARFEVSIEEPVTAPAGSRTARVFPLTLPQVSPVPTK